MTQTDRIDGLQASVAIKAPCRVATTAAITLAGLQTVDGVALAADDRVLVKDQTDAKENGIYVAATAAWSRAKDFNGPRDAVQGTILAVTSGTTHGGTFFKVTASGIAIGTTDITVTSMGGTVVTPLPVGDGGTGAPSAEGALTNLGGTAVGRSVFTAADAATARTALGLGTAAVESVTAGGSGGLLRADGDGSGLNGIRTDSARTNIVLWAFRTLTNGGLGVRTMVDGVVDAFVDETGVDGAASTNETYDGTGDYYHNPAPAAVDQIPTMTSHTAPSGTASASTEYSGTYAAWRAMDDSNATNWSTTSGNTLGWLAYEFAAAETIASYALTGGGGDGVDSNPQAWTLDYWTGSEWTTLDTVTGETGWSDNEKRTFTIDSPVSASKYRIDVTANNGDANFLNIKEFELFDPTPAPDMTLQSEATAAEAQPGEAFIVAWEEDVDAVTLNTDLKAWASRDGGTTWTQATLSQEASLSTGRLLTGTADVSGQPAGTSMKWRLTTHNSKELRVHGVGLDWR